MSISTICMCTEPMLPSMGSCIYTNTLFLHALFIPSIIRVGLQYDQINPRFRYWFTLDIISSIFLGHILLNHMHGEDACIHIFLTLPSMFSVHVCTLLRHLPTMACIVSSTVIWHHRRLYTVLATLLIPVTILLRKIHSKLTSWDKTLHGILHLLLQFLGSGDSN